jgi:two-component system chemotaxis response regulator CheB
VLDDGVLGAAAIRSRGGVTLVQHPDDALYAAMPLNAVEAGVVDHQVTAAGAGQLLMQLVDRSTEDEPVGRDANMELENRIARAKGSLQSVAEGQFPQFPVSDRACLDRRGAASGARR